MNKAEQCDPPNGYPRHAPCWFRFAPLARITPRAAIGDRGRSDEMMNAPTLFSRTVLLLAFCLLSACDQKEPQNRILEWGPDYYSISPEAIPQEFVDTIALEALWRSSFDTEGPSWDGSGEPKLHCIVQFDDVDYSVSLPQYPPNQKDTMRFFDVYIRDPNSYSMNDDIMLTFMFDQNLKIISVALNASRFETPYTKQIFVAGESSEAPLVVAREVSKQARRLIPRDDNSYWGKIPNFLERFIIAICNHTRTK